MSELNDDQKRLADALEELKEHNKCYDIFSNAVSKKGIPLHIINKMLPAINSEISKILSRKFHL